MFAHLAANAEEQMRNVSIWIITWALFLYPKLWSQSAGAEPRSPNQRLIVENHKKLDLPEERARVLLESAWRVVAQELHLKNTSEVEYSLTLVLGEQEERFLIDKQGRASFYLAQWNEPKFAFGAISLAIQQLANHERLDRLRKETIQRANRVLPVSPGELKQISPAEVGQTHEGRRPLSLRDECSSSLREIPCWSLGSTERKR
jgi:hypothetical protein